MLPFREISPDMPKVAEILKQKTGVASRLGVPVKLLN